MWENQTKQEQQVSTPFVRRSSGSGSDAVLFVQSVLCLIAVLICVGIRAALPGLWQDLRSLGNEMLSAGIGFEADTEFARFANAAASELDALFRGEVPAGIGGFGEKSEGTVPDGASLEEVSFDRTFELPLYGGVTSPFGFRKNPLTGYTEFHTGTDIAAAEGTPVAAALSGQVCRTGYSAGRGKVCAQRGSGSGRSDSGTFRSHRAGDGPASSCGSPCQRHLCQPGVCISGPFGMRRSDALEAAIFLAAASVGLLFDGTGLLRMTLCASAAHELGHWTAYVVLARHIPRLRLRIGGLALQGTERLSGGKELGVLAAGPLVNFLLAGLCLAAAARHAAYALYFFAAINLC